MDNPASEMIETVHRLTLQTLARVSADLSALEALASAEEAVPDRRESAPSFSTTARNRDAHSSGVMWPRSSASYERGGKRGHAFSSSRAGEHTATGRRAEVPVRS